MYDDQFDATQWECGVCRFKNCSFMPVCEVCSHGRHAPIPAVVSETTGLRALFLGEAKLAEHQAALRADAEGYKAELTRLLRLNAFVSSATMARATATLVAERQHKLADECLKRLSVAELVACVKFLDAPRKVRQLRRKLEVYETRRVRRSTKRDRERDISLLEQEMLQGGNMTGSFARKVRGTVRALTPDRLEFFLLMFPVEPWRDLADLVHFSPKDFSLEYFLPVVHGAEAPGGSLVAEMRAIERAGPETGTEEVSGSVCALLDKHPTLCTMYSYLRKGFEGKLDDTVKLKLAHRAPLEDVLWFYEELDAPGVETAVHARLAESESLDAGRGRTNYGKLMERLLYFRTRNLSFTPLLMRYAEDRLKVLAADARATGEGARRVAVLGDASGSMEVAINTSTILGSLLSVCLDAELHFFNDGVFPAPLAPKSAADVLRVTELVPAQGVTSPAAALWPFYEQKKACDLFIVVSDEEENTESHGYTFAKLFAKYRAEVNPSAACFLVSFLAGPSSFLGKMNAAMRVEGISCRQFRLDGRRPDLSKLPNLLAMLKLELGLGDAAQERPDERAEADGAAAASSSAGASSSEKKGTDNKKGKGGKVGNPASAESQNNKENVPRDVDTVQRPDVVG